MKKFQCEKIQYLSQFYKIDKLIYYKEKNEELFNNLYNKMQPQEYNIVDIEDKFKWYVDSPDGFVPVKNLICKGSDDIISVTFTDGSVINTSPFHCFERSDGEWLSTVNLYPGNYIISNTGYKEVLGISDIHTKDLVYDLAVDHQNHRYYTNGLSSHNSGAGKSLFLQNLALNWALTGLNVVYISLELSEALCSLRLDAMSTGFETREVMKHIDDVHLKIKLLQKKHKGTLRVKQLPNGCTANDIRAFIKEYEIQCGLKVDALLVDYLDLCMPASKKISAENLFVKDKYVSEELRNLAIELNTLLVTAGQLNRSSYENVDFDPSHIAGGISKVNTADNVIGIFTSPAMKEAGRYQIQFMKTRSSAGVGSRIDLAFDMKSLRISDLDQSADNAAVASSKSIYETLKKKSVINEDKHPIEKEADTKAKDTMEGAAALRGFLKRR